MLCRQLRPSSLREHVKASRKRNGYTWIVDIHDWVNKGLGMSSHVCATGHIKDPMPLIEKNRASSQW